MNTGPVDVGMVAACSACASEVVQAGLDLSGPASTGLAAIIGPGLWLLVRVLWDEHERRRELRKKKDQPED